MKLSFRRVLPNEARLLINWLGSDSWPFHGTARPTLERLQERVESDWLGDEASQVFWIVLDDKKNVGVVHLFDLEDLTPLFDLRLQSSYRGLGVGRRALEWLTHYIFTEIPTAMRIEGYTREDNLAMRQVFRQCGYVKEAHHRQAWPVEDGKCLDSIGYGTLRDDWLRETTTPVLWDDEGPSGV